MSDAHIINGERSHRLCCCRHQHPCGVCTCCESELENLARDGEQAEERAADLADQLPGDPAWDAEQAPEPVER